VDIIYDEPGCAQTKACFGFRGLLSLFLSFGESKERKMFE